MVDFHVRVLGRVGLVSADRVVALPPQLAKVLAVLAAEQRGRVVEAQVLARALWPERPEPERLYPLVAKLRKALGVAGLTVSTAQQHAGYRLEPAPGPGGVRVREALDRYRLQTALVDAEALIDQGAAAEAVEVLRRAAATWSDRPFSVADVDWETNLPAVCERARAELEALRDRLALLWVTAGLLTGDRDVLGWLATDPEQTARLARNQHLWLLRIVALLDDGDPTRAVELLERLRRDGGYGTMARAADDLVALHEFGARFQLRLLSRRPTTPGPDARSFADHVAAVREGEPDVRTHSLVHQDFARLREIAAAAGVRTLHVVVGDLGLWRAILAECLFATLRDPLTRGQQPPTAIGFVVDPRPFTPGSTRVVEDLAALLRLVARRGPVVVVVEGADRLAPADVDVINEVAWRCARERVGFALLGDRVAGPVGAPGFEWLAAAAITEVDLAIDTRLVGRVVGTTAAEADEHLAAATRSGAVRVTRGRARFASAELRDAVLTELSGRFATARRLHHNAFTVLSGTPAASYAVLAWHALAAQPDLPDDVVAGALSAAAWDACERRSHEEALDFAQRGLAVTSDPELRFALHLAQGDAHHSRADMPAASTAYHAALRAAVNDPVRRATAVVRLARRWSAPGRTDQELLPLLERSRAELVPLAADPAGRRLWLQVRAHLAHKSTMALPPADRADEVPAGVREARALIEELRPDDPPEVVCDVLTECRWALYDFTPPARLRDISEMLERAAHSGGPEHFHGEAVIATAIDQLRLGELHNAQATAARHREITARSAHGLMPWLQSTLDTMYDLWRGNLAAAEQRLFGPGQTLLDSSATPTTGDSLRQTWMAQVFWLRREQGRMSDLRAIDLDTGAQQREYFPVWMAATAFLHSETDNPAAAVDGLHALFHRLDGLRSLPPHGYGVTVLALVVETIDSLTRRHHPTADLVDLCHSTDKLLAAHAGELVLAGWPAVLLGPVEAFRARLALAVGDFRTALSLVDGCANTVRAAPAQLGWFRVHRARALLGLGHAPEARSLLDSARIIADQNHLHALATATRQLIDDA
ncbi:hypothetical protein [Actinokineospora sp. NBRC 105648]|uniref:hypothetical protein n=1 Tax=Actinokineospora sp. NBRC 105648 TaxID=3032206 RepID=UPI0024A5A77E|nr:hypothetical protein [Actinokineospora sp. NBRC 105648]GLZ38127.1 hypothetical protein Acsp05_17510 [Actinokineospora sp. NBRC 105648]